MATVAYPENWADSGIETAVFSDPAPLRAVIAAIHERESLFRASEFDTALPPIELVRHCSPEARRDTYGFFQVVREVPNRILASAIYHKIERLTGRFVDMEYDYAARDWSEFPIMLSARFSRGEHPMGWCPDYCDPELDDSCEAWQSFLADARWWLDRMTVVPVAVGDYRFAKRVTVSATGANAYNLTVSMPGTPDEAVTETGTPLSELFDVVVPSVTTGTYQNGNNARRLGASASLSIEQNSLIEWSTNDQAFYIRSTSRREEASTTIHADLCVRNRFPSAATLLLVACGAGRYRTGTALSLGQCTRTTNSYSLEYNEPSPDQEPSVIGADELAEKAYQPLSGIGVFVYESTHRTLASGTIETTKWSHDYSDHLTRTEADDPLDPPTIYPSNPPTVYYERIWDMYPRPGLMGLAVLGPNVAGTIAAGARSGNLLPWAGDFNCGEAEEFWLPEDLHGDLLDNERITASVLFGVAVIPVLDFSESFRFKTTPSDPEENL